MHEMLAGINACQGQRLLNDVTQHDISVKPKSTAAAQQKRVDSVLNSVVITQDQLLDFADLVVGKYCRGCVGEADCLIRGLLLETGVDVVDKDNIVCPYQIKED